MTPEPAPSPQYCEDCKRCLPANQPPNKLVYGSDRNLIMKFAKCLASPCVKQLDPELQYLARDLKREPTFDFCTYVRKRNPDPANCPKFEEKVR